MKWEEIEDKQGVFCLSLNDLQKNINLVQHIMNNIIVTRCEFYYSGEIFVYEANSLMFDDIEPGMKPKAYQFRLNKLDQLSCKPIDANYQFFG